MSARREFPAKVKVAAFERAQGHCEGCTARLYPGRYHYDHRIPDALGGEPALENCTVLCLACHGQKTAGADQPAIAKVKRVRRNHLGARKPSAFRRPPGVRYDWRAGRYRQETT
jgi:5-methylcytosine-specific restriction protein A